MSVVQKIIVPYFQQNGFLKKGHFIYDVVDEVAIRQINIQPKSNKADFYISIGILFKDLCELTGDEFKLDFNLVNKFNGNGLSARLNSLNNCYPELWSYADEIYEGYSLTEVCEYIASRLTRIRSLQDFSTHEWFNLKEGLSYRLLTFYSLNRMDEADSELDKLCERFKDRKSLSERRWWLNKYNLNNLRA